MVTGTHLIIANLVYKHILGKFNFKLDWPMFAYGNIQPDLDKSFIDCDHTLEDSLQLISFSADDLINSIVSVKQFSLALGIICHCVCDYFCLHHTKEYWKKDSVAHGIYETKLHASFLKKILAGGLTLTYKCSPEKNVELMVLKLRRKYNSIPRSINRDINFSIISSLSICEMITSEWLKFNNESIN